VKATKLGRRRIYTKTAKRSSAEFMDGVAAAIASNWESVTTEQEDNNSRKKQRSS
jgi:hypothetical protein